jgi:hypothetical protein
MCKEMAVIPLNRNRGVDTKIIIRKNGRPRGH